MEGPLILVDEPTPDFSYRLLRDLSKVGRKVLCISREHPEHMRSRYPLSGAEYYWLVTPRNGHSINSYDLRRIEWIIGVFIRRNPGAVISIEGIEFLMVMNGYGNVRDFLLGLQQVLPRVRGTCIVAINARTLRMREFRELARAFPMVRSPSGGNHSSTTLFRSMKASSLASKARSSRESSRTP